MLFMRKTTALPSAAEALPGRAQPIRPPRVISSTARQLQPPYPEGLEQAVFGLGCFWGAERKFWELAWASSPLRWAMPAAHAEPDL
jgi:peptide-methionine (S)-S-oxide reductase